MASTLKEQLILSFQIFMHIISSNKQNVILIETIQSREIRRNYHQRRHNR